MTWRGPMRLPEPTPVLAVWKTVEPLPSEGTLSPRRRRTVTCPCLTIDGETQAVEDIRDALNTLKGVKARQAEIKCSMRPGVLIEADYSKDVCLSSWSRGCCFLPILDLEKAA